MVSQEAICNRWKVSGLTVGSNRDCGFGIVLVITEAIDVFLFWPTALEIMGVAGRPMIKLNLDGRANQPARFRRDRTFGEATVAGPV